MTIVESLTADQLARTRGDADALRQIIDRFDPGLNVGPLERTMRLWDISATQLGVMFGVSRQAMANWLSNGPPALRRSGRTPRPADRPPRRSADERITPMWCVRSSLRPRRPTGDRRNDPGPCPAR